MTDHSPSSASPRRPRFLAVLGIVLGCGGILAGIPLVRANDGIYDVLRLDFNRSRQAAVVDPGLTGAIPAPRREYQPRRETAPRFLPRVEAPRVEARRVEPAREEPRTRPAPRLAAVATDDGAGASLNRRTVCVRTCDGYFFPVGDLASDSHLGAHESACQAACPGAPTKLFTVEAGSEDVSEARARDGSRYRSLPAAFSHLKRREATCSCQGADRVAKRLAITRDMTLRPGDVIMTRKGALVFTGAKSEKRITLRNFEDFRQSPVLSKGEKQQIDAVLGVSQEEKQLAQFKRGLVREARNRRTRPATPDAATLAANPAPLEAPASLSSLPVASR